MPTTKMYLYDQKRIIEEQNKGILDEWKTISFNNFHDSILDQSKPFPCYFAVDSEKHGWSRYIFSESAYDENELFKLRDGIYEYIKTYQQIAKRTTLVIFLNHLINNYWLKNTKTILECITILMRNDPEPWNAEIPIDPYNAKWEFCFGGEPIFVVCRAPIYSERKVDIQEPVKLRYNLEVL